MIEYSRWLASCALLLACTHTPLPSSPASKRAPLAKPALNQAPIFELPALGLRLRPPGPLDIMESDGQLPDGPLHMQGVSCSAESQDYLVARYFRGGRDRAKDEVMLAGAKKALKTISREANVQLGEWSGLELEGTPNVGGNTWMRVFVVGDGFWIAQVQRAEGAIERTAAQAFFDSIAISAPWSVHAFPDGHFSALMPDGGVRLDKKSLHAEDFTVAEGSWLGGSEVRMFFVWAMPLEEGPVTADERMDHALEELLRKGNRVIWQAPLMVDGARGRDFLLQSKSEWMRLRLVISATNLYMLQAAARTKEGVEDDAVPRFLDSLRWY